MDISGVLNIILIIVFCLVGVALIVFLVELIKTLRAAQKTINDVEPTLKNVETITTEIQPTLAKIDPLMDRVQLTVDSLNLEMMRVDQILEDVSEITDTASSATAAVDNITNAPLKAVSNVASKVKFAFGGKDASEEAAQLAEQRVAVAQALKDYEAAEGKTPKGEADDSAFQEEADAEDVPKSYVEIDEGTVPAAEPQTADADTWGGDVEDAE